MAELPRQDEARAQRRLWVVNHYAMHPIGATGGLRHYSLARELALKGWDTTIIAASTDHKTRRQRSAETRSADRFPGVRWQWIGCPSYDRHPALRLVNIGVFATRLVMPGAIRSKAQPDVIIGSTVHPLAAWAALRLARREKVPFVFEVRDLWPETLIELGAISRRGVVASLMRWLEGHLYRRAALIVTTMPDAYKYIETFDVSRDRIVWVSNGTNVDDFELTPPPMNEVFRLVYYGAHGHANDIGSILRGVAVALERDPAMQLQIVFVGSGPLKARLRDMAATLGLADVAEFQDPVPRSGVPELSYGADGLVVSVPPLGLYKYGISQNKLFDYLASGRPILFAGSPSNNPVSDADAGVWVEDNSPQSIAAGILELVHSTRSQRARWGRNGVVHARAQYSYAALARKMDDHLTSVIGRARRPD